MGGGGVQCPPPPPSEVMGSWWELQLMQRSSDVLDNGKWCRTAPSPRAPSNLLLCPATPGGCPWDECFEQVVIHSDME